MKYDKSWCVLGFNAFFGGFNHNVSLVALDIGCYRACAHMRFISKNRVPDIVIMRSLNIVEKNNIFQLHRCEFIGV